MSSRNKSRFHNPLFVEVFASKLYFDELADTIFGDREYGPHLLLGSMIALSYSSRAPLLLAEPWRVSTSACIIGGLWLGLIGARYMRNGYIQAIEHLQLDQRPRDHDYSQFETIVSLRVQIALYVLGLVAIYSTIFFQQSFETLIGAEGTWPVVVRMFVAVPIAYLPIMIDAGTMFLGVHFLLPRRLEKADLNLFFYDPRNMGGFAPIGQLLKRGYYVYTGGLLAYFFFIYIPIIFSGVINSPYESNPVTAVFFSFAWLAGVLSIAYSMWKIHSLMVEKKEQRLQELETDLREIVENPYDIRTSRVVDEGQKEEITRQLEHVRNTKEYPTTFTMWSQILISVILPQVLNMAVQFTG